MDLGSDPMTLIIINYVKMVRTSQLHQGIIIKPQQIIQEAIKIIVSVQSREQKIE